MVHNQQLLSSNLSHTAHEWRTRNEVLDGFGVSFLHNPIPQFNGCSCGCGRYMRGFMYQVWNIAMFSLITLRKPWLGCACGSFRSLYLIRLRYFKISVPESHFLKIGWWDKRGAIHWPIGNCIITSVTTIVNGLPIFAENDHWLIRVSSWINWDHRPFKGNQVGFR